MKPVFVVLFKRKHFIWATYPSLALAGSAVGQDTARARLDSRQHYLHLDHHLLSSFRYYNSPFNPLECPPNNPVVCNMQCT